MSTQEKKCKRVKVRSCPCEKTIMFALFDRGDLGAAVRPIFFGVNPGLDFGESIEVTVLCVLLSDLGYGKNVPGGGSLWRFRGYAYPQQFQSNSALAPHRFVLGEVNVHDRTGWIEIDKSQQRGWPYRDRS